MEIKKEEIRDRILDNVRPVDPDAHALEGFVKAAEEILQLIEERREKELREYLTKQDYRR